MRERRWVGVCALGGVVAAILTVFGGCGRSSLLGYTAEDASADVGPFDASADVDDAGDAGDARAEGGTCDPAMCPSGCCDALGACRTGSELQACGAKGATCADCASSGFDFCDPTKRACARQATGCNLQTCPDGCCGIGPQGPTCFDGTTSSACGVGGKTCDACDAAGRGQVCDPQARKCVAAPSCGPGTCDGCCKSGVCVGGQDIAACGAGGQACVDCSASATSCVPSRSIGGTCEGPPPKCTPTSCASGCCNGDTCLPGTDDGSCGTGGVQCANCSAQSEACTKGACAPPPPTCNATNCPGCCDAVATCHAGFLNDRCGSDGRACADCTAGGSTCDLTARPRVCGSEQTTCPAPYPSCPDGVTTAPVAQQKLCPVSDLQDARAACASGAHSPSCQAFFQFEQQTNAACATCLAPFDFTFNETRALFLCVAPFVNATCDHETGCAVDCSAKSCDQCDPTTKAQCQNSVRQNQCRDYYQQSVCTVAAFAGAGAFCNPANYGANFGAWLEGVGGHYCGD